MPTSTDLVTDLPADFEVFGQAVDTQMKTNADAAINKTIVDAKGDIIAATAADTVARLAVGSNNQVLTADSSTATGLKWAAASSGSMTLISTTNLTSTNVTLSSIPQTYKMVRLILKDFYHTAGTSNPINLIFTVNSLTNAYAASASSNAASQSNVTSANGLIAASVEGAAYDNLAIVDFYEYASTATVKYADTKYFNLYDSSASTYVFGNIRNAIRTTSAISSISIGYGGATFGAGTVELWGIN